MSTKFTCNPFNKNFFEILFFINHILLFTPENLHDPQNKKSTYILFCWELERSNMRIKSLSILDANELSPEDWTKFESMEWKICSRETKKVWEKAKKLNKMKKNCYANLIANYRSFCAAASLRVEVRVNCEN